MAKLTDHKIESADSRETVILRKWTDGKSCFALEANFHGVPKSVFEKLAGKTERGDSGAIWKSFHAKTEDGIEIEITAFLERRCKDAKS